MKIRFGETLRHRTARNTRVRLTRRVTYVGAETSGLFGLALVAGRHGRRTAPLGRCRRLEQQVFVGADVEARHRHVVHAHPVGHRVAASRSGRPVFQYSPDAVRRPAPVAHRPVVDAFVELDVFAGDRRRARVLLVLSAVVRGHRPAAAAQPLAEPRQRHPRERRGPGHGRGSDVGRARPVHTVLVVPRPRYQAFEIRHG